MLHIEKNKDYNGLKIKWFNASGWCPMHLNVLNFKEFDFYS